MECEVNNNVTMKYISMLQLRNITDMLALTYDVCYQQSLTCLVVTIKYYAKDLHTV